MPPENVELIPAGIIEGLVSHVVAAAVPAAPKPDPVPASRLPSGTDRTSAIEITMPNGTRINVDALVNEKALAKGPPAQYVECQRRAGKRLAAAPVIAAIRDHVFAAEKINCDDTTVPVRAPGFGRTKTGRLCIYVRDDRPFCGTAALAAAYFVSPDRVTDRPTAYMASFTGTLQADGYAGFERLYGPARTKPGPIFEVV